ncbi:hypothetical protein SMC26_31985 [Actinomadura fulvescens]|uniref:hypothetical protein n=1 Tax=Actinomadura fulvescens TaxID=46160 RepID=UPI0031D72FD8
MSVDGPVVADEATDPAMVDPVPRRAVPRPDRGLARRLVTISIRPERWRTFDFGEQFT